MEGGGRRAGSEREWIQIEREIERGGKHVREGGRQEIKQTAYLFPYISSTSRI